jgi:hypothetical protein
MRKRIGPVWAAIACVLLLPAIPLSAANGAAAARNAPPPENLSGKIILVDPDYGMVVVQGQDGIPIELVVTPSTRIRSGGQAATLRDLARDMNKSASVKFTPASVGDLANSIRVSR